MSLTVIDSSGPCSPGSEHSGIRLSRDVETQRTSEFDAPGTAIVRPPGRQCAGRGVRVSALALGPVRISESDQEILCDDLVQQHGGHVTHQSQRRASRVSEGISDRVYHVFDQRITFEVKAEDGKLTQDQFAMLELDYRANLIVACGTIDDLRVLLPSVRRSHLEARALGWRLVQLWAARGFRKQTKTRRVPRNLMGGVCLALACAALLACTDPARPPLRQSSSGDRVMAAIDTLNAAIATFYQEGGRIELLQLLYPDAFPPDSSIPPVVVVMLRKP